MNDVLRRFMRQLLILAVILAVILVAAMFLLPDKYVTPTLPFLLIFHTAATLFSFLYIQKKTAESPRKFVNVYLANTTIKLVLYLAVLMVYSIYNFKDAINFIISFFIMYVIFTFFEVIHLLRANKQMTGISKE